MVPVLSWLIALWMCYIFLGSLPYKFTNHPDTQHIFSTIGDWLGGFLGEGIGGLFTTFGAFIVGGFELLTALVLLSPIVFWLMRRAGGGGASAAGPIAPRPTLHAIGGVLASMVMAGAVFFHLVSPLGVEVLHEGQSDGGSLFYAATSILVLGLVLFAMNAPRALAARRH